MGKGSLVDVILYLRKACQAHEARDLSDGELLHRFVVQREEVAFSLLVQRHGRMVLGVCRRVLGDEHSAEDSFQATFLVLARRARSIKRKGSVGAWLLCYLEGKSHDRAAQELGWPKGTLARRMTRGRELLRQQLVRRGIGLSAGALATALTPQTGAAPVSALLTIHTVKLERELAMDRFGNRLGKWLSTVFDARPTFG
jgi:hypothetical protein